MKCKKHLSIILALVIALSSSVIAVNAKSVKMNKTKITLNKGETYQLKLNGTSKKVKWKSSKTSVAAVTSKGKVTAKKKGTAKITAAVGKKKYTCTVKVETPKLNKSKLTLDVGKTAVLKAIGTSQKIIWSSSNKSVAVVSNGKVTAKSKGKATITAKINKSKYQCNVTVNEEKVQSISLDKSSLLIAKGENAALQVTFSPFINGKVVKWETSDSNVVTVSNGIVSAVGVGSATVTASIDEVSAVCNVLVEQKYGKVSGNVTYLYNNFIGNKSDTGSNVYLIPKDGSAKEGDLQSHYLWNTKSALAQINIYYTEVDGTGNYIFDRVPTGDYLCFIKSKNTTSPSANLDKESYKKWIENDVNQYISSKNAEYLAKFVGYNKYTCQSITVYADDTTNYNYDFGITYD